jgi:ATP-dependent DNA helicase RecG
MSAKNHCQLLKTLLQVGKETPWLEFKHNCPDERELGSYVSAIANSAMLADKDRGFIVFGIQDGTLAKLGTSVKPSLIKVGNEGLANWLNRKIDPPLKIEFHEFSCDGLDYAVIEIEPSYYTPVKCDGIAYIRIGEHKKRLHENPEFERSLWLATGKRRFEDAIALSNVSRENIFNFLNVEPFFRLQNQVVPESEQLVLNSLVAAKLLHDELDGTFSITNLGAILLATDISKFPTVGRKTVRVIQYRGNDVTDPMPEIEGKKGYAAGFEGLVDYVSRKSSQKEVIEGGVRRSEPVIPAIAIREFIANALIHQDLSISGGGPVIEIFSNRIEIANPGIPLGDIDRLIDDVPRSRNEKLATAMRMLGLCEERGRGLDKSVAAIELSSIRHRLNLPAPTFRKSSNGFIATLFGPRLFKELSREEKKRACFQHCILGFLKNEYMSNSSLRARFSLADDDYQAVSSVIADAKEDGLVVDADTEQGRRNAKYIPFFAKTASRRVT